MLDFDPFDYKYHDDPYPVFKELRDQAPLYHNEKHDFWILSRYADCLKAARDFKTFTSGSGTTLETLKEQVPIVQSMDPPNHTRVRNLLASLFTPEAVKPLEDGVRRMALELLEPHLANGRMDMIADFSARLPMAIICQLLGFPRRDEDALRHLTDTVCHRDDGVFEMPEAGAQATRELYAYYEDFMRDRARGSSEDDLVGHLMAAERDGTLSHEEVLGYLYILSIAGNETTTKLIGNMTYQLHKHPAQKATLLDDPSLIASAVEETLRYDGPSQQLARIVGRDVEMHGITLKPGDRVGMLFISANRDERHYPDAETYDVRRNPRDHLGFGGGLHACLGAALARLEARIAFQEIMRLMPDFEVEEDGLERMHSPSVRGYTRVPIRFTGRA